MFVWVLTLAGRVAIAAGEGIHGQPALSRLRRQGCCLRDKAGMQPVAAIDDQPVPVRLGLSDHLVEIG